MIFWDMYVCVLYVYVCIYIFIFGFWLWKWTCFIIVRLISFRPYLSFLSLMLQFSFAICTLLFLHFCHSFQHLFSLSLSLFRATNFPSLIFFCPTSHICSINDSRITFLLYKFHIIFSLLSSVSICLLIIPRYIFATPHLWLYILYLSI